MAFEHGTPNRKLMEYQQSSQLPIHLNPRTNQLGFTHSSPDDDLLTNQQKTRERIWTETYTASSGQEQAQGSGGTAPNPSSNSGGGILSSLIPKASELIGNLVHLVQNNAQAQSLIAQGKEQVWNVAKDQILKRSGVYAQNPADYGISIASGGKNGIISTAQTELAVRQQPLSSAPHVNTAISGGLWGTGGSLAMGTPVKYWLMDTSNSKAKWAYIRFGNNLEGQGYVVAKSAEGLDRLLEVNQQPDGSVKFKEVGGSDLMGILPFVAIGIGAYLIWKNLSNETIPRKGLGSANVRRRRRSPRPDQRRRSRPARPESSARQLADPRPRRRSRPARPESSARQLADPRPRRRSRTSRPRITRSGR